MQQQGAKLVDIGKRSTPGQFTRRIDRWAVFEVDAEDAAAERARRGLPCAERPLTIPFATDDIKALEREARRIDRGMAGGTGGVGPMPGQVLTDRRNATGVGIDGRDPGWRRRIAEARGKPASSAALLRGKGIGEKRLADFGAAILDLVAGWELPAGD